jgi:hypothetical protein
MLRATERSSFYIEEGSFKSAPLVVKAVLSGFGATDRRAICVLLLKHPEARIITVRPMLEKELQRALIEVAR